MRKAVFATLSLAALLSLGVAMPAQADTVTMDYTVTAADPVSASWPGVGAGCSSWNSFSRNFTEVEFFVTATGTYDFVDQRLSGDGRLAFLVGAYDPTDTSNCFGQVDDLGSIVLTAGVTYTMMRAGFSGLLGDFSFRISGPGALTLGQAHIPAPTKTAVAAVANPVLVGAATALTASITGTALTGTVEFFDGATSLGSAPVANGAAVLSVSTLALGDHAITAVYSGDFANLTSTSDPMSVTVVPVPAATLPEAGVDALPLGLGALALLAAGVATLATRRVTLRVARLASRD